MEVEQQSSEDGDMAEALRLMEAALVLLDRAGGLLTSPRT